MNTQDKIYQLLDSLTRKQLDETKMVAGSLTWRKVGPKSDLTITVSYKKITGVNHLDAYIIQDILVLRGDKRYLLNANMASPKLGRIVHDVAKGLSTEAQLDELASYL